MLAASKCLARKLAVWVHYAAATAGEFLSDVLFDVTQGLAFHETGCGWAMLHLAPGEREREREKTKTKYIYI